MDEQDKKICKMCRMEIAASAKKCPYCHHWQYTLSLITFHPVFGMLLVLILFVPLIVLYGMMFQRIGDKGEAYADHPDALEVVESTMSFGERCCGERDQGTVVVLGTLENHSDITWKKIWLEVQFFDNEGIRVDAHQKEKYSFVVPAHDKAAFRVYVDRQFPEEKYAKHKVRVLSATERGTLFD